MCFFFDSRFGRKVSPNISYVAVTRELAISLMAGLQTNIYIAAGFTWPAAFLALVLRFIARRITKIILGYEDYFCIIAFVSTHLSYSITKTNAYNSYAKLWASGYCSLTIYCTE